MKRLNNNDYKSLHESIQQALYEDILPGSRPLPPYGWDSTSNAQPGPDPRSMPGGRGGRSVEGDAGPPYKAPNCCYWDRLEIPKGSGNWEWTLHDRNTGQPHDDTPVGPQPSNPNPTGTYYESIQLNEQADWHDAWMEYLKERGRTRSTKEGVLQYWQEPPGQWVDFPPEHQPDYIPPLPEPPGWDQTPPTKWDDLGPRFTPTGYLGSSGLM